MSVAPEEGKQIDTILDVKDIMALLPHRPPFVFVERLQKICLGESAEGIKQVTMNEPFFQGHFPGEPVMPGVLIIEALAQTAAVLVIYSLVKQGHEAKDQLVYFMSVDKARFRKPVVPGDTLLLRVKNIQSRQNIWKFSGQVFVGETLVADAVYTAMLAPRKEAPARNLSCV